MTEANFSFTTKLGPDLFTVRGMTADEFDNNLTAAIIGGLHDKAAALQEAISGTAVERVAPAAPVQYVEPVQAAPVAAPAHQYAPATHQPSPPGPVGNLEMVQDRWGNAYTYGHPNAPQLPDGRGAYIQKAWTTKAGKPAVAWVDPVKGPKPAKPGATIFEPIYIN